jgi:hypothetical protein
MLTYTGIHVTREFGAPSIRDMAIGLMREPRFGGGNSLPGPAGMYPVGIHTLVVADILRATGHAGLEADGLLHDGAEAAGLRDVCRPMKTYEGRKLEETVLRRIYEGIGRRWPSDATRELIHKADMIAVKAEGALGISGRGFCETQPNFNPSPVAKGLIRNYLDGLRYEDFLEPDGRLTLLWEKRLRRAMRRDTAHDAITKSYTEKA